MEMNTERVGTSKLNILWLTDNKDTVFNMLSMYAINAIRKGW